VRTPNGERRIEDLAIGDLVDTVSGVRPVKWIGHRKLNLRKHAHPEAAQPVRILANAFGAGLPARDLSLSPRHCIAHAGVLIPIEILINGKNVVRLDWNTVEYFRLELEEHNLVWAEGLPTESYLYGSLRADYDNQDGPLTLHPTFDAYAPEEAACLPIVIAGPGIATAKAVLARNARIASRVKAQVGQIVSRRFGQN
jgi:collagen type I/II/III/V/XI/XXIV/XXVII alpha